MPFLILIIAMLAGIFCTQLLLLPWGFLIGLKLPTWLAFVTGVLLVSWLFGD